MSIQGDFVKKIILFGLLFVLSGFVYAKNFNRNLCHTNGYDCFKVRYSDSWESLFPDSAKRYLVMRVNRMNIPLSSGMIIAVPRNLDNLEYMMLAPFPQTVEPSFNNLIVVSFKQHAFAAYERNGYLVHWGPVSAGRGWCEDINRACNTPHGSFYVYSRGDESCKSTKFPIPKGGAPMPYCMFFYRGFAMHGGDLPGYHASHGCIRLFREDAEWLNKNFVEFGQFGTKVIVK